MHLLIDEKKCSGCRLCQQVCAFEHFREINPKRSAIRIKALFPAPGIFRPIVCDQCGTCAAECPAEAIYLEDGAYKIDSESCTGCGVCAATCPLNAVVCHAGEETPMKCDLCLQCTVVCNTGALRTAPARVEEMEDGQCTVLWG